MKNKSIIIILLILSIGNLFSQDLMWARLIKSNSEETSHSKFQVSKSMIDKYGNFYVSGNFSDTLVLDHDNKIFTQKGLTNRFFSIYDKDGNYKLANVLGPVILGTSYEAYGDFEIDSVGNIYSAMSKRDNHGNFIWSLNEAIEDPHIKTIDPLGNIYIAGVLKEPLDLDFGSNVYEITNGCYSTFACRTKMYFAKYDNTGNFLWAKELRTETGTRPSIFPVGIDTDKFGNLYIHGRTAFGPLDFDPGSSLTEYSNIAFLAKYDSDGNFIWVKDISNPNPVLPEFTLKVQGEYIIATGKLIGTRDFDPSDNIYSLTATGLQDVFIACYGLEGNLIWAKQIRGLNSSTSLSPYYLTVDKMNNIYVAGKYNGSVDFDAGTGEDIKTVTSENLFFLKYDANGNYIWSHTINSGSSSASINIDREGNIILIGDLTTAACDFDVSNGESILYGKGLFIAKYSQPSSATLIEQAITFPVIEDVNSNESQISLGATGGDSNNPIIYSIETEPSAGVAMLSGNIITVLGPGKVTVTANQEGNEKYEKAQAFSRTFYVLETTTEVKYKESQKIAIYPNPAKNYIRIMNDSKLVLQKIEICNLEAKSLVELNVFANSQIYVEIPELKQGFYVVKLTDLDNQTYYKKICIE